MRVQSPNLWTTREFHQIPLLTYQYPKVTFVYLFQIKWGFSGGSEGKESAHNAGDLGSIPGSIRSPGEGNGNRLQYSCLGNPMDRGARQTTVHGIAKSQTGLTTSLSFLSFFPGLNKYMKDLKGTKPLLKEKILHL